MTDPCLCGHHHATTRGPCTRYDTCDCRQYLPDRDSAVLVARRRRALLAAVDACPHPKRYKGVR